MADEMMTEELAYRWAAQAMRGDTEHGHDVNHAQTCLDRVASAVQEAYRKAITDSVSLLASTEHGKAAMVEAIRGQGYAVMRRDSDDPIVVGGELFTHGRSRRTDLDLVVAALRAAGWTCCPPGARAIWVLEENGEPTWDDEMCWSTQADAQSVADDYLDPTTTAVRYVRCDAPGTAEGGALSPEVEVVNVGSQRIEVDAKTAARLDKKLARIRGEKRAHKPSAPGQGGKG